MMSLRKGMQSCAVTNCFDVGAIMLLCVAWEWIVLVHPRIALAALLMEYLDTDFILFFLECSAIFVKQKYQSST
jgi:hypothetical protein